MSIFVNRLDNILSKHKYNDQREILNYFYNLLNKEIENNGLNTFISHALTDLIYLNDKYKILNENRINILKREAFNHKILHLRATILDLISINYFDDTNIIDKPEKWIIDVIDNFITTFDLHKNSCVTLLKDFNTLFIDELESIFITKSTKFGSCGNILVLNLFLYEIFISKYFVYDFNKIINKFIKNIKENKSKKDHELKELAQKYYNKHFDYFFLYIFNFYYFF
ncbi:hypothetical protein H312_02594 [Anncaliia algerae PRA339]|uniref:Uncharacterized protein n=1 Tax=Anncaliia algerae PRA339 TaxID=1288291 RepID=A0A059EY97_9MICR|nr:hypothetical protein H312_02594 [Anncaliia algerae PRA339]